jgi:hypothetical protein
MNRQEAAGSLRQEREFLEMGPGACEGGGGREISNAAPLGVIALALPDGQWERKPVELSATTRDDLGSSGRF